MSMWAVVSRFLRRYVFSPESFLLLILIVVLYNTVVNISPLWQKARTKLSLQGQAKLETEPDKPERHRRDDVQEWSQDKPPTKVSWEKTEGNAAVYAIQGRRPHMEDRYKIMNNGNGLSLYGIFDGHGGEFAAEYVEKNLFSGFLSQVEAVQNKYESNNLTEMLTKEILHVDREILDLEKRKTDISGTTSLVAMVTKSNLIVANVGDSRGVVCDKEGKAVPLSMDHKPHLIKERKRIKDAGGFVSFNGVWRVAGILATSRALGDYPLKEKNLVIADPDFLTFDLSDLQPKFMILASDGLWDCFSNEEAVEYIKDRLDEPHFGAKSIILQAYYRGSLDNITVMVVKFKSGQAVGENHR